ncbi:MAG: Thioesterase thiol ester dehydrase-isomerase [Lasallia pustulata]|uniref:Thioesterase thiol ester dehydrase-isomerase n=1 Tax=Lasallia pustulata TaxID=136370 RepID=A0A5M8PMI7_9LECA|nr:MAG: Thioesterase thiol ester dehydrase-isomerase [Lasallia pustulata]
MRVKTPWIEALRRQREQGNDLTKESSNPASLNDRALSPKKMSDSYHRLILPLAQDPWLLDNYLNASGHIRLGTIFMDLDALSGVIAYKHTGESVTTVTAAVDRITIANPLDEICDLELSGQVTFATGRSSMEISLQVAKVPEEGQGVRKEDILMTCAFTMVSLDPSTKKPVSISPLLVETDEERRLFNLGEKNSNAKKALAKTALLKQTPNDQESDLIHAMWLKQLEYHDPNVSIQKPHNVVYMDKTILQSSQIMQPQYRNRHNFMIFGGFLLKQTFELAFCCAASFSHSRPTFVSLDPSTFENPVPVGSVLYLTATVAYTDPPLVSPRGESEQSSAEAQGTSRIQVRIDSKVRDIEHGKAKPTGQFNYTFLVERDLKVMPRTYSEFMIWVDAKRRAERVSASIRQHQGHDDSTKERVTE